MSKGDSERKMPDAKPDKNELVTSTLSPVWITASVSPWKNYNKKFWEILSFYVFHSPVSGESARGMQLANFGWGEKAKQNDFSLLKARLIDQMRNENDCFECVISWPALKESYIRFSLEPFPGTSRSERVVFRREPHDGKRPGANESLLSHIRNALAHGRLTVENCPKAQTDLLYIIEDVDKDLCVTARMILRQSTLIKWIAIIQAGPFTKDEVLKEILAKIK